MYNKFVYDSCLHKLNIKKILIGICRETNECFLYAVPDRKKETLLETIECCIEKGSTIVSDMWKSYNDIEKIPGMNYQHLTVNHSTNFVDPESGAHTQTIESTWGKVKYRNKKECGTNRNMLDSYLCEFLWRKKIRMKTLLMQY